MKIRTGILTSGLASMGRGKILVCCVTLLLVFLWTENVFSAGKNKLLVEVRDLEYHSTPGAERVVIYLSTASSFSSHKLPESKRFYIDLKNARMGNSLKRHDQIMNGFLKTVRIGQFNRKTVRIVFDLENNGFKEKISKLQDPDRLVVDFYPTGRKQAEKEVKTLVEKTQPSKVEAKARDDSGADLKSVQSPQKTSEPSAPETGVRKEAAEPLSEAAGLEAEMEGRWEDAIKIYKSILTKEPQRGDLWAKLGELEYYIGNYSGSAEAFQRAVQLLPNDPKLHFRLAHDYSVLNDPNDAFSEIEKAVEFDPNNVEYLKARAQIANWIEKSEIAIDSYKRILALSPDDETLLNLARTEAWIGELDESVKNYKSYYAKHSEDRDALLGYVQTEEWRGNFPSALSLLEKYRYSFGETTDYLKLKARIFASAERPTAAMTLISPLLEKSPDDYEIIFSQAVAQHYANRPREALDSVKLLEKLRPLARETDSIRRFVTTPIRSNVELGFDFYADSDHLDIYTSELKGTYFLVPETYLEAGVINDYLTAEKGSGLEQLNGDEEALHTRGWLGVGHRFSPKVAMAAQLGASSAEGEVRVPTYNLSFDLQLSDELKVRAEKDYGYYVVSPRTVSIGVRRDANRLQVTWSPDLNYTIDTNFSYDTFSDNNTLWEILLVPRRAVLRSEKLNLDIGLNAWWFGFDEDFNNGYYAPELYQRYMVTGFSYWKINEENGVSFIVSLGVQKDNTMDNLRFGADASFEGTFGIYRDWMFKIKGGATNNIRQGTGAFRALTIGAALTRRF